MSKPEFIIIDSDDKRRLDIANKLRQYTFHHFSMIDDAASYYLKHFHRIRLVLLNVNLSDKSQFQAISTLYHISNLAEVITYSEDKDLRCAVLSMKEGAYNFLSFPFNQKKLIETIEDALDSEHYAHKLGQFSQTTILQKINLDERFKLADSLLSRSFLKEKSLTIEDLYTHFPSLYDIDGLNMRHLKKRFIQNLEKNVAQFNKTHNVILTKDSLLIDSVEAAPNLNIKAFETMTSLQGHISTIHSLDVVVLDIDSLTILTSDTLKQISQHSSQPEIVIFTSHYGISNAVDYLKLGVYDFCVKPILFDEILVVLHNARLHRYKTKLLPTLRQKLLQNKLNQKTKMHLLSDIAIEKEQLGRHLIMDDIYFFFPELKKTFIPQESGLPKHVKKGGLETFITALQAQCN